MKYLAFVLTVCAAVSPAAAQTQFNTNPTRTFGHARLTPVTTGNPNVVEGREFYQPLGIAVDTSASPPILYVADTFNNRVLAWKNAAGFNNGDSADLVIGQRDKFSTLTGGPGTTLSHGLSSPVAVAVDRNGNLYVADSGNNRILRYPHPFSQTDTPIADLVIGQASISSGKLPNQGQSAPSASTLSLGSGNTAGLAFDSSGNLWFTDSGNNRVLRYNASALSAGGSVSADLVLGQHDFVSATVPAGADRVRWNKAALVAPSGIAISQANDVYVSDSFLRVLYYRTPAGSGVLANRVLGVVAPTKSDPRPLTANGCP